MAQRWYDKNISQTQTKLNTNIYSGLSKMEASKRLKRHGENIITPLRREAFISYLKQLVTDLTSILLIVTALIAAVFERSEVAILMIVMLVINYFAALFTYVKSQRVFERMEQHSHPNAKVLREGKLYMIKQERLVIGDIIYLSAGDIVPADARLVESDGLRVLEGLLTGEKTASEKDASFIEFRDVAPAHQKNMVFASSIVTSGTARAIVTATAGDTLVYALNKNNKFMPQDKLKLFKTLHTYSKILGLVMLGVVALFMMLYLFMGNTNRTIYEVFILGLSLAVASMSEFFTAFGYIIIGCGVFNLVKQYKDINTGALIKNPEILDKLKDITYLIVPKDGVFLVNDNIIERFYVNSDTVETESGDCHKADRVLRYALISTGLYGSEKLLNINQSHENVRTPEEDSIIRTSERLGIYNIALEEKYPIVEHRAADNSSRFETTLVKYEGGYVVAVRGDASRVLSHCTSYCENGKIHKLDFDKKSEFKIEADRITKDGYRVLAIASKNSEYTTLRRITACQSELIFEGFIAIKEPLLRDSSLNISKCRAAGIRVIMMTDDCGMNNRRVAEAAGILNVGEEIIDAHQIDLMKKDLFITNIPIYSVFEGLSVSQKRFILNHLKESGETVGLLGSSLEEVILMKDADVSFSKSMIISEKARKTGMDITGRNVPIFVKNAKKGDAASGCEALKYISDVMVSEADQNGGGGINAVISAIAGAKVIYRNLTRMIRYLMTSQIARLIIALWSFISSGDFITPAQILFCGIIVDFVSVVIIAFERPSRDMLKIRGDAEEYMSKPLRHNIDTLLFAVLWAGLTIGLTYIATAFLPITNSITLTSCVFVSFVATQFVVLSETLKDKSLFVRNSVYVNGLHLFWVAAALGLAVLAYFFPAFGRMFDLSFADIYTVSASISVAVVMFAFYEIYKLIKLKIDFPGRMKPSLFDENQNKEAEQI